MTARTFLPLYALLLLLAGCATRMSEPLNMGQGVYMLRGSNLGFLTSTSDVVSDIQSHASGFCASSGGRALQVVSVDTTAPADMSFPEGRLQFRCVERPPLV